MLVNVGIFDFQFRIVNRMPYSLTINPILTQDAVEVQKPETYQYIVNPGPKCLPAGMKPEYSDLSDFFAPLQKGTTLKPFETKVYDQNYITFIQNKNNKDITAHMMNYIQTTDR